MINEKPVLVSASIILFVSAVFSIVGIATPAWSYDIDNSLLGHYNQAPKDEKDELLWVVGCAVLIILSILCQCFSAVILLARFFGQSRGRAKLGGFLSIFAACVLVIGLGIFMGVKHLQEETSYGYSFGLVWASVPLSLASGVIMFFLKDDAFLKSEVVTYSAVH